MTLWMAALMLWMLDASLNLTMGPFRAFVADQMSAEQRSTGYLMYMFFASVGAVVGSLLPWAFASLGVSSHAPPGEISDAVKYAFYVGATLLISAVCWSAFTTREFAPEMLEKFDGADARARSPDRSPDQDAPPRLRLARDWERWAAARLRWLACAPRLRAGVRSLVYGVFLLTASRMRSENAFTTILGELDSMSASMRWLALVQFCSWFTLVHGLRLHDARRGQAALRIQQSRARRLMRPAPTGWACCSPRTTASACCAALIIPYFVRRFGMRMAHRINLWMGAAGLLSMMLIRDPDWLLVSMIGLGFAWASIIALPYAMLANNLPSRKMGVNIGIFNIFIVIPQLLAVGVLALVARRVRRWRSFVCARHRRRRLVPRRPRRAATSGDLRHLTSARKRTASPPPGASAASMRSFAVTRRFSMTSASGLVG